MASPAFLERFKDRASILNRHGDLETAGSKPVSASVGTGSPSKMRHAGQIIVRGDSPNHKKTCSTSYDNCSMAESMVNETTSVLRRGIGSGKSHGLSKPHSKQTNISPEKAKSSREAAPTVSIRSSLDFIPYTLREYETTRVRQYQELGGLGPAIGSDQWKRQKEARDRRIEYSRLVQDVNSQRLPGSIALLKDKGRKLPGSARDSCVVNKLSRGIDSADT